MSLLSGKLPTTVKIRGKEVAINSDFRASIKFEGIIQNPELTEDEKILQGLQTYYHAPPEDFKEAIDQMIWFYQCGEERTDSGKKSKSFYDFEYDSSYIYSGFLEQYQVDLEEVESLHWWKFRAMFESLKEDCMMGKIMRYRCMDLKGLSKEDKQFYKEMKRIYKLPDRTSEAEKKMKDAIAEALINGGDLTGLL